MTHKKKSIERVEWSIEGYLGTKPLTTHYKSSVKKKKTKPKK